MRPNPMRAGVERGELQIGTWVNMVRNPAILPLLKAAGLDFARVDMEHSSPSMETIADMAVLARALDFPDRRAPAQGQPRMDHAPARRRRVEPALPAGRDGRARARDRRGLALRAAGPARQRRLGAATDFERTGTDAERRAFANAQVFVTVMLETARAFEDLDEIAAMHGIDALTLGPADLAQDLGVFGTPDQARALDEKRDLILAAARKHGKTCAMLVVERGAGQAMEGRGRAAARLLQRRRDAARRLRQAMAEIKGG